MAESANGAGPPTLAEVSAWLGCDVDDAGGSRVGKAHAVFSDAESTSPSWLVVALGRRGAKKVVVPVRDCAGGGGRVWAAHRRESLRDAPAVDPKRPLLREHELTICAHYGIPESVGRAAEVRSRGEGSVTSQPAGA